MWKFSAQVIGQAPKHLAPPRLGALLPEDCPADVSVKVDHRRVHYTLRIVGRRARNP